LKHTSTFSQTVDWEDSQISTAFFSECTGRMMTVAGAGDNASSLLGMGFSHVSVVASNPAGFALFELKIRSIQSLHPDNVYNVFGVHPSGRRVFVYHQLRSALSQSTRDWWDEHEKIIREGLLLHGEVEQHNKMLRMWCHRLRLYNRDGTIDKSKWNGRRGSVMAGRFPIIQAFQRMQESVYEQSPYVHMVLSGVWDISKIQNGPSSLSYAGMERVRTNKVPWTIECASLEDWLLRQPKDSLEGVLLGPIAEDKDISTQRINQRSDGTINEKINEKINGKFIDEVTWMALSNAVSSTGKVLCWSKTIPSSTQFIWQQFQGVNRSVYSGSPWVGTPKSSHS